MSAANIAILSEVERAGKVASALLIGEDLGELAQELDCKPQITSVSEFIDRAPEEVETYDLVVYSGDGAAGEASRVASRALALAIALTAGRVAIVAHSIGQELSVPLIEVKRGLMLDAPDMEYRVYGRVRESE